MNTAYLCLHCRKVTKRYHPIHYCGKKPYRCGECGKLVVPLAYWHKVPKKNAKLPWKRFLKLFPHLKQHWKEINST